MRNNFACLIGSTNALFTYSLLNKIYILFGKLDDAKMQLDHEAKCKVQNANAKCKMQKQIAAVDFEVNHSNFLL